MSDQPQTANWHMVTDRADQPYHRNGDRVYHRQPKPLYLIAVSRAEDRARWCFGVFFRVDRIAYRDGFASAESAQQAADQWFAENSV